MNSSIRRKYSSREFCQSLAAATCNTCSEYFGEREDTVETNGATWLQSHRGKSKGCGTTRDASREDKWDGNGGKNNVRRKGRV